MKKRIKLTLALLLALLPMMVMATSFNYKVMLFKSYSLNQEQTRDKDGGGRRTPSRPIQCTISEAGIVTDVAIEDVIAYELWDADGEACLASFADGVDAAAYLFATPGEYQLRIITDTFVYSGVIL